MPGPIGANLLGQPEISERMMRALEIKGDLPQTLIPQYQPGITALDLTEPEFNWLRRTAMYFRGVPVAAVAAQFSYAALLRNTGAGFVVNRELIAVVDKIELINLSGTPTLYYVYMDQDGTPSVAALSNTGIRDDRIRNVTVTGQGGFTTASGTTVADRHVAHACQYAVPATSSLIIEGPWILTGNGDLPPNANPLTYLVVQTQAVNTALICNFFWRERSLMPSEL